MFWLNIKFLAVDRAKCLAKLLFNFHRSPRMVAACFVPHLPSPVCHHFLPGSFTSFMWMSHFSLKLHTKATLVRKIILFSKLINGLFNKFFPLLRMDDLDWYTHIIWPMFLTAFSVECSIDYSAFDVLMNYLKILGKYIGNKSWLIYQPLSGKKKQTRNTQNEPSGWADYIFFWYDIQFFIDMTWRDMELEYPGSDTKYLLPVCHCKFCQPILVRVMWLL